jgi:hypothetical protein
MSQHTPGPWQVDAEDSDLFHQDEARFWINADGLQHIGYVDGPRTAERIANARLIAAAPDLLAALKAIEFQVRQGKVFERDACITQARAAIAKAIGGAI